METKSERKGRVREARSPNSHLWLRHCTGKFIGCCDWLQVLSRDWHRRRVPVNNDVTVPAVPALVHAAARLRTAASLHDEESHCLIIGRFVSLSYVFSSTV